MIKNIVLFIAVLLLPGFLCTEVQAEAPAPAPLTVKSLSPKAGIENTILTINGTGFGDKKEDVSVKFTSNTSEFEGFVLTCAEQKITVLIPPLMESDLVTVTVTRNKTSTVPVPFAIYASTLVDEAISLKKAGKSDEFIADLLYNQRKLSSEKGVEQDQVFGVYHFAAGEPERLSQAGLSDDFIKKLQGQNQYITVGLAGVWLNRTSEFVPAPLVRIFLIPRSYYDWETEYFPHVKIPGLTWLLWPAGLGQLKRWDLNIGVTTSTSTTENPGDPDGKTNYIMVGLSHEINRAALLNVGVGVATGSTEGIKKQTYFGVTVDSNLLKLLGIMNP